MTPSQAHKPAHGGYPGRVLSLGEMLRYKMQIPVPLDASHPGVIVMATPRNPAPFASLGKAKADAQRDARRANAEFEIARRNKLQAEAMNDAGDIIGADSQLRFKAAMLLDQGD